MARRNRRTTEEPLDFETECPRCATLFDVAASATEAVCPSCSAQLSLVEVDDAPAPPTVEPSIEPEPFRPAPEPEPAPEPAPAQDFSRTIALDRRASAPDPEPEPAPEPTPEPEPVAVQAPKKKWKDPILTAKGVQERRKTKGATFFETPCPGCNTTLKVAEDARRGPCPWCGMALEFEDVVEEPVAVEEPLGEEVRPEPVLAPAPLVEPEEPVAVKPVPAPRQPILVFEAAEDLAPAAPEAPAAPSAEPVKATPVEPSIPEAAVEAPKVHVPTVAITRATSPIVVVATPPRAGPSPLEEVVGVTQEPTPPSPPVIAAPRAPLVIASESEILAPAPKPEPVKPTPKPAAVQPSPVAPAAPAVVAAPSKSIVALESSDELQPAAAAPSKRSRFALGSRAAAETLTCPACRTEVPVPKGELAFQCPKCQQFLAAVDPAAAANPPKPLLPFLKKAPPTRAPAPAPKPVAIETVEPVLAAAPSKAAPRVAPAAPPARVPLVVEDEVATVAAPAPRPASLLVEEEVALVAAPKVAPKPSVVVEDEVSFIATPRRSPPAPQGAEEASPPRAPKPAAPRERVVIVEDAVETAPVKPAAPVIVEEEIVPVAAPAPVQEPKKRFGFLSRKKSEPVPAPAPAAVVESEPEESKPRFPLRRAAPEPAPIALESSEDVSPVATAESVESAPKRRFGIFGRRKDEPAAEEVAASVEPEPAPVTPPYDPTRTLLATPPPPAPLAFSIEEESEEPQVPEAAPEPAAEPLPTLLEEPQPMLEPLSAAEQGPEPAAEPDVTGEDEREHALLERVRREREDVAEFEPVTAAPEAVPEPILERAPEPMEPAREPSLVPIAVEPEPTPVVEPRLVEPEAAPLAAVEPIHELERFEPLPEMGPSSGFAAPGPFMDPGEAPLLAPRELHRRIDRLLRGRGHVRRGRAEVALVRARPITVTSGHRAATVPPSAPSSGVIVKTEGPRLVEADFGLVRGVSKRAAESLREAGYRTFGTFVAADADKLGVVLGVPEKTVRAWQRDADLGRIGLSDEEARWVRAVGAPTVTRLAKANPRGLARRVAAFAAGHGLQQVPDGAIVAAWVARARKAAPSRSRARLSAKGKKR